MNELYITTDPLRPAENPADASTIQKQIDEASRQINIQKALDSMQAAAKSGRIASTKEMTFIASEVSDQLLNALELEITAKKAGRVRRNGRLRLEAITALPARDLIALGITVAFNTISSRTAEGKSTTLAALIATLGKTISTEVMVRAAEKPLKLSIKTAQKRADKRGSRMSGRVDASAELMESTGAVGLDIDDQANLALLLITNMVAAGILETRKGHVKSKRRAPPTVIAIPAAVFTMLEALSAKLGSLKVSMRPRLIVPETLTTTRDSFSTSPNLKHIDFLQSRAVHCGTEQSSEIAPTLFEAANRLQSVPFKINTRVLDVIKAIFASSGRGFGVLPVAPPRPVGEDIRSLPKDPTDEQVETYRKAMTAEHNRFAQEMRQFRLVRNLINTANEYSEQDQLYLPAQCDFRGRIYYRPQLSPTGGDLPRGLLEFSQRSPLGPTGSKALSMHLSATFGDDKLTLEEREAWAVERSAEIVAVTRDPLAHRWWTTADEPFQFLAACFEWQGYVEHGEDYESDLMVAVDATCSGLQHLSAILRDPATARATNLVNMPDRQDVYLAVAEGFLARLKSASNGDLTGLSCNNPKGDTVDIRASKRTAAVLAARLLYETVSTDRKLLRKLVKQPVMSLAYGVTATGMQQQVLKWFEGSMPDLVDRNAINTARMVAELIQGAAVEVLPGAIQALDTLTELGATLAKAGSPLRYVTPTGFEMVQEYRKPLKENKPISAQCAGTRLSVRFAKGFSDELSVTEMKAGAAANVVHALDASHLSLAVSALPEGTPVATVHDAFMVRPSDLDVLQRTLRDTFVQLYADRDILGELIEQSLVFSGLQRSDLPNAPELGEWCVADVASAAYAFS